MPIPASARAGCLTLRRDNRGVVSVIGVLSLTTMIGMTAFVVELGQGYTAKVTNQRVADLAALGGAVAYASTQSEAVMLATARDIANANGMPTARISIEPVANYKGSGVNGVKVDVTTAVPLRLARVLSASTSYDVTASAVAALPTASAPACIIALSSSAGGISLKGGTSLNAGGQNGSDGCAIASNAGTSVVAGAHVTAKALNSSGSLSVVGGSSITATTITYGGTSSVEAGSSINGALTRRANTTADPLADDPRLPVAFAKLGNYVTPQVPSVPTGEDLTLGWYPTTMSFQGRTATMVNNKWTFPAGTYNIRNLNTQSLTLEIQGPSTVTVSSSVTVGGGGKLIIGDGSVAIKAPITMGGGTSLSIGSGRHYLGKVSLSGGATASIGAGDLDVNGSIAIDGGGSAMTVGAGNVAIGNNGSGNAINLSGGSRLTFSDGKFSANGGITTSGGSTLVFGKTENHLINGTLSLQGNSTFGAGIYTINGDFTNNTGGTMIGRDVSFILKGTFNLSGGTSLDLRARPSTSTSSSGLADILIATLTSADTFLGGGTQDIYSGAVYIPNSNLIMTGGAGIWDPWNTPDGCFMLIAKSVTLDGGPSAASTCKGIAGSTPSGSASLIQ